MKRLHLLSAFVLILLCANCKNEQNDSLEPKGFMGIKGITVNDGRLSFDNFTTYLNFVDKIGNDESFQQKLLQKKDFASLQSVMSNLGNSSYQRLLPLSYQQILNANAEVMVGEDLVWYSPKGENFFVKKTDLTKLKGIKDGTLPHDRKYKYGYGLTKIGENSNARVDLELGSGGDNFVHVQQFNSVSPQAGQRRYVHEFATFTQWLPNGFYRVTLLVNFRLEWRGCCDWQYSTQTRTLSYDLVVAGRYKYLEQGIAKSKSFNQSLYTFNESVSNIKAINVAYFDNVTLDDGGWPFSVTGNVTHNITGDVSSNRWVDTW